MEFWYYVHKCLCSNSINNRTAASMHLQCLYNGKQWYVIMLRYSRYARNVVYMIHADSDTYRWNHECKHTRTLMHCTYIFTSSNYYKNTHACKHVRTHTHTHVRTRTHARTHAHTHTHTHVGVTQKNQDRPSFVHTFDVITLFFPS